MPIAWEAIFLSIIDCLSFCHKQIGSRITSKRIAKMLEECFPCSYIMVDKHPFRHDPSHIVTHRIQSDIFEFAEYVLKAEFPHLSKEWSTYLQMLNAAVMNFKELGS